MKITRSQLNQHPKNSDIYTTLHARRQRSRGRKPASCTGGNPREQLFSAEDNFLERRIEFVDETLAESEELSRCLR